MPMKFSRALFIRWLLFLFGFVAVYAAICDGFVWGISERLILDIVFGLAYFFFAFSLEYFLSRVLLFLLLKLVIVLSGLFWILALVGRIFGFIRDPIDIAVAVLAILGWVYLFIAIRRRASRPDLQHRPDSFVSMAPKTTT